MRHKRYIDADEFILELGKSMNVQLMSFFDCCREIPTKGRLSDEEETNLAEKLGQSVTFYAKEDGGKANAGSPSDMLSPTTAAFIYFLKANPGGRYPNVLNHFQYAVLKRCDTKINTTRNIIFVKPNPKIWSNEDLLDGLDQKVERCFPSDKKLFEKFYIAANEAIAFKTKFTDALIDPAQQLEGK